jgi:hypothetical protein
MLMLINLGSGLTGAKRARIRRWSAGVPTASALPSHCRARSNDERPAALYPTAAVITASVSPADTEAPAVIGSSATVPAL